MARRTAINAQSYISGSTVRKPDPRRVSVPARRAPEKTGTPARRKSVSRGKTRMEVMKEKRQILRDRELEHIAKQERLRSKSISLDRPFLVMLILASICTLGLSFSYIRMQTEMNSRISSIESKKQRLEQLRAENDALQNSIDTSIDPNEIYRIATQELGMVYAGENQVITYDKTESEYVRQYENIPKY